MDGRLLVLGTLILVIGIGGIVGTTSLVSLDGDQTPAFAELHSGTDPLSGDTDGDGLTDTLELDWLSDPTLIDTDGDGLNDRQERKLGTDPTTADTDDDGLSDAREVDLGTDPTARDTDEDGLEDGREIQLGTDPMLVDTDEDGLEDAREVDGPTDPTVADTDGDGLEDGREVTELGTDPTVTDSDGDGLDDGRELTLGTDPTTRDTDGDGLEDGREVTDLETDPTLADTDDDGLDDGREVEGPTDPLVADTDDDGLEDGREVELGTDPTEVDSDGDGFRDGAEVYSPSLPGADPTQIDVYLEIDRMEGTALPESVYDTLRSVFADAPVTSPAGTTGIDLHLIRDDVVPAEAETRWDDPDTRTDFVGYRDSYRDYGDRGYHYVLLVNDVVTEQSSRLIGLGGYGSILVERLDDPDYSATTIMHELAHSLGWTQEEFRGVDSTELSFEEYTSVMNYNAPLDYYGFASAEAMPGPENEWERIFAEYYVPPRGNLTTT